MEQQQACNWEPQKRESGKKNFLKKYWEELPISVTETVFALPPKTTKRQTKHIKQWFSEH